MCISLANLSLVDVHNAVLVHVEQVLAVVAPHQMRALAVADKVDRHQLVGLLQRQQVEIAVAGEGEHVAVGQSALAHRAPPLVTPATAATSSDTASIVQIPLVAVDVRAEFHRVN